MYTEKFLIPKVYVSYGISGILSEDDAFNKDLAQSCILFFSSEYGNISEQEREENDQCDDNNGCRIGRYMSEYGELLITYYCSCIKIELSDDNQNSGSI